MYTQFSSAIDFSICPQVTCNLGTARTSGFAWATFDDGVRLHVEHKAKPVESNADMKTS